MNYLWKGKTTMPTTFYRQLSLTQEGTLIIDQLPFHEGERVEITIRSVHEVLAKPEQRYPLWGTPYRYDDPFALAVSADDWEVS
jgi:hypothetical protein